MEIVVYFFSPLFPSKRSETGGNKKASQISTPLIHKPPLAAPSVASLLHPPAALSTVTTAGNPLRRPPFANHPPAIMRDCHIFFLN